MTRDVLIQPWITEKSLGLAGKGWFSFVVSLQSTKPQVADAVEKQFKVHVVDVRTTRIPGKTKRAGKQRTLITNPSRKKALVRLKSGEKIELFGTEQTPGTK